MATRKDKVLVYGANGITGRRIAERCADPGFDLETIAAGRNAVSLARLSRELRIPWRVFRLDEENLARRALEDVAVVINAAGPFSATARPLAELAIDAGAHYVDVSGELDVLRNLDNLSLKAKSRDVALLPGMAFTPLVADFLVRYAEQRMPDRSIRTIRIAHARAPSISKGSLRTYMEAIRGQVEFYDRGDQATIPAGTRQRTFEFAHAQRKVCQVANLAEIETVNASLNRDDDGSLRPRDKRHVATVEGYIESTLVDRLAALTAGFAAPWSRYWPLQTLARPWIETLPDMLDLSSPDDRDAGHQFQVAVEVEDEYRDASRFWLAVEDVYSFSADAAVAAAKAVHRQRRSGFLTPKTIGYAEEAFVQPFRTSTLFEWPPSVRSKLPPGQPPKDWLQAVNSPEADI